MDDTARALQDRLRERRKAMSITMHTTDSQNIKTLEDSTADDDKEDLVSELVEDIGDNDNIEDEALTSRLKEKLESRHDATIRRLQKSEIQARPEISPRSKQKSTSAAVPTISTGQSQELASPRSEMESTLGSTFGRSTGAKSLRSRLQEKLQAAKQQRSMSPMTEERKRTQRLKDRISSSTRFDDPLRTLSRPELEKEAELESKVTAKLRWKKAMQRVRQETGQPSESECYDFFTKQFEEAPPDPDPIPEDAATEPPEGPSAEDVITEQTSTQDLPPETEQDEGIVEQAEETADDKKKLLADVIPEELDWKLVNITAAEYTAYRTRLETEQKINYVPSVLDAPAESKVVLDAVPVYLEEEGFYVGLMPEVQIRNRNILENRILSHEHMDPESWFGPDGRVKMLPNPVKTTPSNPWVAGLEETDPAVETIYVKAYESSVEEKYLQDTEEYELQVDTGTVIFHHHPLMSREHVLASSMSEMYEEYIRHRQKNYEVFFNEKLRTLRLALRTMKRNASNVEGYEDLSVLSGQELRIQDYLTEIRRTCQQKDRAEAYERELMKKIISEWSEIKNLRTVQGFNNTSVKLTVKKQEVNSGEDRKQWQKEIDLQLEEAAEEYNYNVQHPYRKQMTQYQSNLQEWKKKRMKLKQQQQRSAALAEDSEAQSAEEDVVGVNPKPLKPLPPAKFDEQAQRNALITQATQHRRNPGESKISLEVTNTGTITPTEQVPAGEASRRRALQNSAMIARIVFNGREVCTSEKKSITSEFRVHFGQIFKIVISQWPDTVKVQLLEAGRLSNTVLSEIILPVPDGSVNSANAQLFPTEFSSDKIVNYPNHEGVGSSTPFTLRSDTTAPVSLKTRGQLFVSISWGLSEDGNVLAPKLLSHQGPDILEGQGRPRERPHQSHTEVLSALFVQDPDIRALWSQEGKLDPNDPANAGLLTFANTKEGFVPSMDYFRLDQLQEQFNFVTDEEMANARRFKILEYRANGVAEFRNISMVPANEHEILDSAFVAYERRKREKDALGEIAERKVAAGTLSSHRLEVLRFRQRVRDSVLRRFYAARHYHTLQDMVHEDQVPDIGTLGINVLKALEPRRPLKPVRIERKKATAQNLTEGSVKILVAVVRAYNLPVRDRTQFVELNESLSRQVFGTSQQLQNDGEPYKLSPFVSVSFQSNVKTTNIAQGPNPSWNEELELPFSAPNNDYNPESLQTIDDTLFIHIFDRVVMDVNVDNRDRNEIGETSGAATGVVSHRIQNHWLGSLKLPFSTIYQQGKIDGTFKLNVPLVMLGYSTERGRTTSVDPYDQMESQFLQPQEGSYVTLFVTLEPELGRPEPVPQKFETQEDQHLINESLKFLEECKNKFPKRRVKATVIDINGESVFVTRYIKPLPPPPSLLAGSSQNSLITAERIARFVSLIPFVSDNVIYAGTCDLWSTCDQFLNMLCGDEEEHALLLVNYFLHLGKQAYLVLGNAIPEGETAYVLTLEMSQEYLLWNASTGQHYKTNDGLCPLQGVHALVSQDNIWFNMQVHEAPSRINFNVNNTAGWKPLFRSSTVAPSLPSVQPDSLVYPDTDLAYVQNLEERIERTLKDSIMNWRPRHVTRWNRSCSSSLRQLLQGLETERWRFAATDDSVSSRRDLSQGDHADRLRRLIGGARFVGAPMDMPFTDIDSVVKAVRSTEFHKIQDSDIEFALAVYVHPYPASVLCVWVYVAALNSRSPY